MDPIHAWLGVHWGVFVGLTLVAFGFAAFMTGQAVADGWKPAWVAVAYTPLLGVANRFLDWSMFGGPLVSGLGFLVEVGWMALVALVAHRLTMTQKMTTQYPWIYERTGPFGWRERREV